MEKVLVYSLPFVVVLLIFPCWEPSMCWAPTMKIARFTHHLLIGTLTPIAIFCTKFVSIILLPVAIARIFFVDRVYVEIHFELTKRTDW